jgi:cell division protein ZapA (FtsZ GTPase activity inhibitor)
MVDNGRDKPSQAVTIELFGREYSIRGHGDRNYLQALADFITDRAEAIREEGHVVSTLDVVILTLLTITDEMFQYKLLRERTLKELEEKTEKLRKIIDRAV